MSLAEQVQTYSSIHDSDDDESIASPNLRSSGNNLPTPPATWLSTSLAELSRRIRRVGSSQLLSSPGVLVSAHWRWQKPRLRLDWQHLESERMHAGQVSTDEVLWVVIITMGVAGMRSEILVDLDVEWYVLHFFCFVRVVSAALKYSSRFNDHDLAHQMLWAAFTVGLLLQIAFLDHDMRGFAMCTSLLYCLIAAAHLRVACLLPRGRVFCYCAAGQTLTAAYHRRPEPAAAAAGPSAQWLCRLARD